MSDRRWSYLLLIASFSGIVVATLWPFKFMPPANLSLLAILDDFAQASDIKDYWRNIILFMPFGGSLTWILSRRKLSRSVVLIIILVTSLGLSFSVELTQSFLPMRISNFTDIVTNTLGGVVGAGLYSWRQIIFHFTVGIFQINGQKLTVKSLSIAWASCFSLIVTAILVLLISGSLNNWNDDFPLSIGNEATGNRPWQGYVNSIYLSDRALADQEITAAFGDSHSFFGQLPNLVVSLAFNPNNPKQSLNAQIPPLQWQGSLAASPSPKSPKKSWPGVFVSSDRWLKSKGAINTINRRFRKSNEFSLSTIIATDRLQQNGLARIFSISEDPFTRNLTLGQNGHYLSLRLRTPITGENGSEPEFIIPNVFQDQSWHQVLITFAHNTLNFYIDKPQNKYTFIFEPAVTFPTYYPMLLRNRFVSLKNFNLLKYQIIFYVLTLMPLGFLGGLLLSLLQIEKRLTGWWIGGIFLVPALVIEQLSVTISDRPVQVANLLLSIAILSGTILITKIFCWQRLSKSHPDFR